VDVRHRSIAIARCDGVRNVDDVRAFRGVSDAGVPIAEARMSVTPGESAALPGDASRVHAIDD